MYLNCENGRFLWNYNFSCIPLNLKTLDFFHEYNFDHNNCFSSLFAQNQKLKFKINQKKKKKKNNKIHPNFYHSRL
jgi:hypothetical protein